MTSTIHRRSRQRGQIEAGSSAHVRDSHHPNATRRDATPTRALPEPGDVLSGERTTPDPAAVERCSANRARRFVFVEQPPRDLIDELCRIDLR